MLARIRSLGRALAGRSRFEEEMRIELRSHIELRVEDLVRSGLPREEAERRAQAEFGAVESVREECRESRGLRWPDEIARNMRYSFRMLYRAPAFTAAAVLTLGLCIGANTAFYSVVDAVLLRPLPYPEPERLVEIGTSVNGQVIRTNQNGAMWEAIRDHAAHLDVAVYSGGSLGVNFVSAGAAEYVRQQRVGAGFFRVLGVAPVVGRGFNIDEDRPGGPPVAVLSHSLWQRALGSDPAAVGRTILLRGEPYTVVGIMPAGFRTNAIADVWTPLRPSRSGEGGGANYRIVGRLRPNTTWPEAAAQVEVIGHSFPGRLEVGPEVKATLELVSMQEGLTLYLRKPLLVLWAAVGAVLLIGCVNIAGLLLARAAARRREIATRIALGGGSAAVFRQMLTESLVLGVCGGTVGVALGYAGMLGLRIMARDVYGVTQPIELDARVLLVTAAVSVLASVIFGIVPALQSRRIDVRSGLMESGGRAVARGAADWQRRMFVVTQIALGFVLLVTAGLLIRTFTYLSGLRPGFDGTGVIIGTVSLDDARYATSEHVNRLFREGVARLRELPGVQAVGVGTTPPYQRALNMPLRRPGREGTSQITNVTYVSADYLQVLRIPLLRGRYPNERDGSKSAKVAVVNEAFVRTYLSREEPLGADLNIAGGVWGVVGVVGDVQQSAGWGNAGPIWPTPQVYIPAAQLDDGFFRLVHTWFPPAWVIRSQLPPDALIPAVQRAMRSVDPQLPFSGFRTMEHVRSQSYAQQRFQAALLAAIAGLALVLAVVGIYGLIANSVTERTRELGIRLALGSTVAQAVRAAAAPGVLLAGAGVLAGLLLARLAAGVMAALIWGVKPTDLSTYLAAAGLLLAAAAGASLIPALQIARLNPSRALRYE